MLTCLPICVSLTRDRGPQKLNLKSIGKLKMIINERDLFEDRRLRKCSARARLFYTYFLALSNGYSRIEFDYEFLAERLRTLKPLHPSAKQVEQLLDEFVQNGLLLKYTSQEMAWGQWDVRVSEQKQYKTGKDKESPSPPEKEYIGWLKEQHGEHWQSFHVVTEPVCTKASKKLSNAAINLAQNFTEVKAEAEVLAKVMPSVLELAEPKAEVGEQGTRSTAAAAARLTDADAFSVDSDSAPARFGPAQLANLYFQLSDQVADQEHFQELLVEEDDGNAIARSLFWAFNCSNYWRSHLQSSKHFLNGYRNIKEQSKNWPAEKLNKALNAWLEKQGEDPFGERSTVTVPVDEEQTLDDDDSDGF